MVEEPGESLPESLREWVEERAAASDEDPSDVISRAVTLYRLVETHADAVGEMPEDDERDAQLDRLSAQVSTVEDLEEVTEGLEDDVASLERRVGGVENDLDEKIADVRERVIQVKRETDSKAPADHGHEDIEAAVNEAVGAARAANDHVEEVEDTVDSGFDNFETVVSHLTDEVETLDRKLTRLASVVVSVRRRTSSVEHQLSRRDAAATLKRTANRHGVTKAKCDDCARPVRLGLLAEPTCPHCDAGFVDIDPASSIFSSATLETGVPPALEAGSPPEGSAKNGETEESTDAAADLLEESSHV